MNLWSEWGFEKWVGIVKWLGEWKVFKGRVYSMVGSMKVRMDNVFIWWVDIFLE